MLCSFFPSVYATIGVNSASVCQPRDPTLPKQLLLCVEPAAVRLLRIVFVKSPFLCAFSKGRSLIFDRLYNIIELLT